MYSKDEISTSDELELLQMVSELGTKRYTNEDVEPQKRWIVRSDVGGRGEKCGNLSPIEVF